jgi:hypothetical protein
MKALRKSIKYLTNIEAMKMVNNFQNKDFELLLKYSDKDYQNLEEKKSKLKEYGLYEFEIIQLFNFIPKQILHLQLVIEEMEERFDEEKLEKILQIFK